MYPHEWPQSILCGITLLRTANQKIIRNNILLFQIKKFQKSLFYRNKIWLLEVGCSHNKSQNIVFSLKLVIVRSWKVCMETLCRGQKNIEEFFIRYWKKNRILVTMSLKVTWEIENVPSAVMKLAKKIFQKNVECHLPLYNSV